MISKKMAAVLFLIISIPVVLQRNDEKGDTQKDVQGAFLFISFIVVLIRV